MVTALTVYGTTNASSTLATAAALGNALGGTTANSSTKVGTTTQWVELFGVGTANGQIGVASIPTPTGNGSLWDVTTLETNQIIAGTWTLSAIVKSNNTNNMTGTLTVRAYVYNGGSYTHICDMVDSTGRLFNSSTQVTYAATVSGSLTSFNTGDKLYLDAWMNITAANVSSTTNVIVLSASTTTGIGNHLEIDTPGYQATPAAAHSIICDGSGGFFK